MLNLHPFTPEIFGRLEMEVYSSPSNSARGGNGPCRHGCDGKKFFDYHEKAKINPYTGETRKPMNHVKKVNYTSTNRAEQQIEKIIDPNRTVSSNVLEKVYKKSELYEATKIYDRPFYNEINSSYNSSKKPEELKKSAEKRVEKKSEIEEQEEQMEEFEEFNLTASEIQFLWNLWSLSLINPQLNERINFLIDFLFAVEKRL